MDRRTKILAGGFGAVIVYVLLSQVVYPGWIKPLLSLDDRVAERQQELDKLEAQQRAVDEARIEYRDFVARIGSFDARLVEMSVRDRLNGLIEKHKLENANVAPARPAEDRKTGITTGLIRVTAIGSLESAVGFLKDIAEIPELIRISNPTLYPASTNRKNQKKDQVNIQVPIELMVLPQHKIVGRIDPATLTKSEQFVRHEGQDYSETWNRAPFTEYVELPPLRVDVQRMVNVEVGQQAFLQATASGGEGNYTYDWNPKEGLSEPNSPKTAVDTSAVRSQNYVVTVTDTWKKSVPATATVVLNVREAKPIPQPVQQPTQPPPPPPPSVAATDPEGRFKQIVMTLLRNAGQSHARELMVNNTRKSETLYYKVGDDMDGGRLVYVHQTGGLVHRDNKFHVYPLGMTFDQHIEFEQAVDYPELQAAARRGIELASAQAQSRTRLTDPQVPGEVLDSRGQGPVIPETHPGQPGTITGPAAPPPEAAGEQDSDGLVGPPSVPGETQPAEQPTGQPVPAAQPGGRPGTRPPVRPGNAPIKRQKGRGRL